MSDPNYIRLEADDGWFDELLKAIDINSRLFPPYKQRNEAVKAKLTKYKRSDDTIRIYRSEYEDIFHILLENNFLMRTQMYETAKIIVDQAHDLLRGEIDDERTDNENC